MRMIDTYKKSNAPRSTASLRYAAAILAMLIAVSVFMLHATAVSDNMTWIADDGELISSSAEDEINEIAARIYQKYNFNIYIATVQSLGDSSSETLADDLYDSLFLVNSDGILLLVCMNEREYAISTSGSAIWNFENYSRLDNITDAVVDRLSFGDYDRAGVLFVQMTESCLEAIRIGEGDTAVKDDDNRQEPDGYIEVLLARWVKHLPAVLVISAIIAFIWVGVMRSGMNNIKKSNRAANYVRKDSFKLTQSSDLYLYSTVTKTPRAQASSGSNGNRGGMSHHSSSGGGHGGMSHTSSSGGSHGGRSGKF